MERPICKTCPYWHGDRESEDAQGECHRRAPAAAGFARHDANVFEDVDSDGLYLVWPPARPFDWCGEHPMFPTYIESSSGVVAKGTTPITALGDLSGRLSKALIRNGIRTVEQLTELHPDEFLCFKHVGTGSLKELVQAMDRIGLGLRDYKRGTE